jgi:hypothetical protein
MDLSMITVRKGVKDELSKWQDIPGRGDPEKLYFGRFTAHRRVKDWKILEISTPEVDSGLDDLDPRPRGIAASIARFARAISAIGIALVPHCGGVLCPSLREFADR